MKYVMCLNCGRRLCKGEAGSKIEIECPKCREVVFTLSNTLFELMKNDEASIIQTMGHSSIDTTKKNYHTIGKFDSVQKVARSFNELYPPKNKIYKASELITFAPDGYKSEEDGVTFNAPIIHRPEQEEEKTDSEIDILILLKEISLHPELKQVLQNLLKMM